MMENTLVDAEILEIRQAATAGDLKAKLDMANRIMTGRQTIKDKAQALALHHEILQQADSLSKEDYWLCLHGIGHIHWYHGDLDEANKWQQKMLADMARYPMKEWDYYGMLTVVKRLWDQFKPNENFKDGLA